MSNIKNISKGVHTQETIHLKARKNDDNVNIEAYGEADYVHINILPKHNTNEFDAPDGHVHVDGVYVKQGRLTADEIDVGILRAYNQSVLVLSHEEGITGKYFTVNSMELGDGVSGDGKAGLRVERGVSVPQYMVFNDITNRWMGGPIDQLKYFILAESLDGLPIGGVFFKSNSNDSDLEVDSNFIYDNTTKTLNITGGLYKNNSPVLNRDEADARYLEHQGDENIYGEKRFHNIVNFGDDVIVEGNLSVDNEFSVGGDFNLNGGIIFENNELSLLSSEIIFESEAFNISSTAINISGDAVLNGGVLLNVEQNDGRYVNVTGDEEINGVKTFHGDANFSNNVSVSGNVVVDGDTILQGLKVYKDSSFANVTISGSITKNGKAVLNVDELDLRYVNSTGSESISGEKTFHDGVVVNGEFVASNVSNFLDAMYIYDEMVIDGDVGITGMVDINGDVGISGMVDINGDVGISGMVDINGTLTVNGVAVVDEVSGDSRYVNSTGSENISGDKTFNDKLIANDSFIISTSGAPSGSNAPGQVGNIMWDSDYLYLCYEYSKWGRVNLEKTW